MAQSTPWAILACKWSDMPNEAKTIAFLQQMFTQAGRGTQNLVDFFDDNSHGSVDMSGNQVFGWLTLPQRWSDYTGSGANPAGRQQLLNWARGAAAAAGINLAPFFNVVVCMNASSTQGTDLFGGGGGVVCDTNVLQPSVLAQEMGHGYGLDHSRIDGSEDDYRDRWDVMSTWDSCFMQSHPDYVLIGPGMNAANMAGRGWLDETRVWSSTNFRIDATIQLRPLHRRDLPGYLAARLGDFTIEFRKKDGWDAAIPQSAVLVHRFQDNHSYLMPGSGAREDLITGSYFQEPQNSQLDILGDLTRVDVIEINDAGNYATIRLEHRPTRVPYVGPGILFGGVAAGGGGWVFVGGKFVPVPPRSPMTRVLELVAAYESVNVVASTQVRESVKRETLSSMAGIVEKQLRSIQAFRQPAPLARELRQK